MSNKKINKENNKEFFEGINTILKNAWLFQDIVVIGGAGFLLNGMVDTASADISIINGVDQTLTDFISLALKINIKDRSRSITSKRIFDGWENNTKQIYKFSNLTVSTVNPELLYAANIFSNNEDGKLAELTKYGNNKKMSKTDVNSLVHGIWGRTTVEEKALVYSKRNKIITLYKAMGWKFEDSDISKLL